MECKQVWEKEEEEFGEVGICPCVLSGKVIPHLGAKQWQQKMCKKYVKVGQTVVTDDD